MNGRLETNVTKIVVQKYCGTSVGDVERIGKVAARVARTVGEGHKVAVTVSAMGHTTDRLVSLAREVTARPSPPRVRRADGGRGEQQSTALLSMALHKLGVKARSFTGQQAGFLTDEFSGASADHRGKPGSGFRGVWKRTTSPSSRAFKGWTPLATSPRSGEGGSDTTAVAVAAAVGADTCDIYTDTEGIYTTDPHLVPSAQKLDAIDYEEDVRTRLAGRSGLAPEERVVRAALRCMRARALVLFI